jgi:hypothetical protein
LSFECWKFFRLTEQRSLADVKYRMKKTAAAILVLIIVSVAAALMAGRTSPPDPDAPDRNVPGATTGPGRNSLMKF